MLTKLVLDTNIVLDWLVFADPLLMPLELAMNEARIELLAHSVTLHELHRVLSYPELKLSSETAAQVMARYAAHTVPAGVPETFSSNHLLLPEGFPVCSDTDDQVFLALAHHGQAALVSRDRAILKLKKRAAKFGVTILEMTQLPTQLS